MCHLYALGRCDLPWQDWCQSGWHVTKEDWRTICANLSAQKKETRAADREGADLSPKAKRQRFFDGDIDSDDL